MMAPLQGQPWAPVPVQPQAVGLASTNDEEAQLQRAIEESKREEEERKRRQEAAEEEERRAIQRAREIEEADRRRQQMFYQEQQRRQLMNSGYGVCEAHIDEEDEEQREALEEAKQVQLALQMSLAEQQRARQQQQQLWDGMRAEGVSLIEEEEKANDHHNLSDDEEPHLSRKGKERVRWTDEGEQVADAELAEALRLSQLVNKPPEERAREEQAIYRSALINEQDREFEESRQRDLAKEEQKRRKRMARDRALEIIAQARSKEAALLPEPSAGTVGATELVVRMPDGRRTRRRFPQEAPLQAIKDWIDVELAKAHDHEQGLAPVGEDKHTADEDRPAEDQNEEENVVRTNAGSFLVAGYDLVTDFPRRVFTDMEESASQAGLCPRALLNVSRK